jgi:hypothetical protein
VQQVKRRLGITLGSVMGFSVCVLQSFAMECVFACVLDVRFAVCCNGMCFGFALWVGVLGVRFTLGVLDVCFAVCVCQCNVFWVCVSWGGDFGGVF